MSDLDTARKLQQLQARNSASRSRAAADIEAEFLSIANDIRPAPARPRLVPAAAARSTRSNFGPAAGTKGGPDILAAGFVAPSFMRLDQEELTLLYGHMRDPLAAHVYVQISMHCDFKTGEFNGRYQRLMELCTPPKPQQGPRRPGPTYKQLRRVVDDLEAIGLLVRGERNAAQGELRLHLRPRVGSGTFKK